MSRRTYRPRLTTPFIGNVSRTKRTRRSSWTQPVGDGRNNEVRERINTYSLGDGGKENKEVEEKRNGVEGERRKRDLEKGKVGKIETVGDGRNKEEGERIEGVEGQRRKRDLETRKVGKLKRKIREDESNQAQMKEKEWDNLEKLIFGKLLSVIEDTNVRKRRAVPYALREAPFRAERGSIGSDKWDKPLADALRESRLRESRIRDNSLRGRLRESRSLREGRIGEHSDRVDRLRHKLLERDKRFIGESKMAYLERREREKAYRSYEEYEKMARKECPEDRVCRLFKEELARQDSFDGMGVWNE